MWCVQRFVSLDEQETIGATDWNRHVMVDLLCLHMKNHMVYRLLQLIRIQLERPEKEVSDSDWLCQMQSFGRVSIPLF